MTGTTWGRWGRHGDDGEGGEDGEDTNIMTNMLAAIYNILYVCVCVHACACVYVHVHMYGDTPPSPRPPTTHLLPPQSCREAKSPKFNNS